MSLLSKAKVPDPVAPRIVIYGQNGVGKTTFATKFPSPIVVGTERGMGSIRGVPCLQPENWKQFNQILVELVNTQHEYKTLIVDSLDWLSPLCEEAAAAEFGKKKASEVEWGKAYSRAVDMWREPLATMDRLIQQGITCVLICHARNEDIEEPGQKTYTKVSLEMHKKVAGLFPQWADITCYAYTPIAVIDGKVKDGGSRDSVLITGNTPWCEAKNRFGMPERVALDYAVFKSTFDTCSAIDMEAVKAEIRKLATGKWTEDKLRAVDNCYLAIELKRALENLKKEVMK